MNYDTFMAHTVSDRRKLWLSCSKEEVVELLAMHRRRWLAANSLELTSDQISVVEEDIRFVETELAYVETNPEFAAHQRELQKRVFEVLPATIIAKLSPIPRE